MGGKTRRERERECESKKQRKVIKKQRKKHCQRETLRKGIISVDNDYQTVNERGKIFLRKN